MLPRASKACGRALQGPQGPYNYIKKAIMGGKFIKMFKFFRVFWGDGFLGESGGGTGGRRPSKGTKNH